MLARPHIHVQYQGLRVEEPAIHFQNYCGVIPYIGRLTLKVTAWHLDHEITIERSEMAPFHF